MDENAAIEQLIAKVGPETFHAEPMQHLERLGLDEERWIAGFAKSRRYVDVKASLFTLTIYLNHQACQDIGNGDISKLTEFLESAGSIGKMLGTLLGLAFKACSARVKAVDQGDGVYLPIPWPILPTLVAAGPIVAWIMVALKPNR